MRTARRSARCWTASPALARLRQQQAPRGDLGAASGYLDRWGEFIVGLSYLWEGQVLLADKLLRPTLAQAEAAARPAQCIHLHARGAARCRRCGSCDRSAEATALLANRLDVIERQRPARDRAARLSHDGPHRAAEGAEHRALELLGALARGGRGTRSCRGCRSPASPSRCGCTPGAFGAETCRELCAAHRRRAGRARHARQGRSGARSVELLREVAHGYAAIAAQDWRRALAPLARAETPGAATSGRGGCTSSCSACAPSRSTAAAKDSQPLLREAIDLAQTYGLARVFDDAHPALGDWVRQVAERPGIGSRVPAPAARSPRRCARRRRARGAAAAP